PFGRITYYPMLTRASRTPLVRLPDESVAFPFNVIRIPASNDAARTAQMVAQNRELYGRIRDELSPNFGDGRGRSGGGGCGLTVGRLGDDLDPVVECHTENEFWQLVGAVETAPAFLRGF